MNAFRNMSPGKPHIWILGGTGAVGYQVIRMLSPDQVDGVTAVSRHAPAKRAQTGWTHHMQLDLSQPDVTLPFGMGDRVINLTEQTPASHVTDAIRRGAIIIDSSASLAYVQSLRRAASEAVGPGYLVDCAGLAPGLTNMMAHRLAAGNPTTRHVEIAVELGLGQHAGLAATEWFLRNLSLSYDAIIDARPQVLRPGQLRGRFPFHAGSPDRIAVSFPFAEQSVLAQELPGPCTTVLSYLALDPPWITAALTRLLRWGAGGILSRNADRIARGLLRLPAFGPASTRVIVRGFDCKGRSTGTLRFVTGDQTAATAAVIAATTLAARIQSSPGAKILTAAEILRLDQAVDAIRAAQPEARLERKAGAEPVSGTPNEEVAG